MFLHRRRRARRLFRQPQKKQANFMDVKYWAKDHGSRNEVWRLFLLHAPTIPELRLRWCKTEVSRTRCVRSQFKSYSAWEQHEQCMTLRFWRGQLLANDLGHERKQNHTKEASGTALTKCQDAQNVACSHFTPQTSTLPKTRRVTGSVDSESGTSQPSCPMPSLLLLVLAFGKWLATRTLRALGDAQLK